MKIGIGITTMGRPEAVARCVRTLLEHTPGPFTLVVSDDGDETPKIVQDQSIYLRNRRGGVARNKNRCLYQLFELQQCDVVILVDDDIFFTADTWLPWSSKATEAFGHINKYYCTPTSGGEGTPESPYLVTDFGGAFLGVSRKAFDQVGYMDPGFGLFGCEHVEYTRRLIENGFGGVKFPDGSAKVYTVREEGFECRNDFPSTGDAASIQESFGLLKRLAQDRGFKQPWISEEDRIAFLAECQAFKS